MFIVSRKKKSFRRRKPSANGFDICFNIHSILSINNVETVCHPRSNMHFGICRNKVEKMSKKLKRV